MQISPSVTAALVSAAVLIAVKGAGFAYGRVADDVGRLDESKADASVEKRVTDLEENHAETRRLAEAAYVTVHGNEDRPDDAGFVIETKERWERLETDIEEVSHTVDRLERSQEMHQQKTEAILDALAEELDVDFMMRGGDSSDD